MRRIKPNLAERQAAMKAQITVSQQVASPQLSHHGRVQYFRESHVPIPKLAKDWGMSAKSLRRLFEEETEGVIRLGTDKVTMFVSESAARRVYARLSRR
jgi:hypothetical protein